MKINTDIYDNYLAPRIDLLVEMRKEGLISASEYSKKIDEVLEIYHMKIEEILRNKAN